MNTPSPRQLATIRNGQSIELNAIPLLPLADFQQALGNGIANGQRVSALFAAAGPAAGSTDLYLVLADDAESQLAVGRTRIDGDSFPSLAAHHPQVQLFEREIAEQFGLVPEGHPWFKPVRYRASWHQGRDAWGRPAGQPIVVGVGDYYRVEGEEIHEVAVGPVHAGVIEPGHFRFQCHGETVFHLEISLGYQHRGVEEALLGGPTKRSIFLAESLSGDTTAGHATAYCQVLEALAKQQKPPRAQALRGIALELERLANHVGDLGALANDVGYLPTASYCGRIRGDFLNMSALLCGSRFSRGMIRPGGVGFDLDEARTADLVARLAAGEADTANAVNLLWDTPSVMARFEDTGPLPAAVCRELGIVGPPARAAGLGQDVRHTHPAGVYRFSQLPVSTCTSGDVLARAYVRWLEIQHSLAFLNDQLRALPTGEVRVPVGPLAPCSLAVSLCEGWRGEICHVGLTDEAGRLARYKVVDPSFHNWVGLAHALRNQQISDFPLCNKSFNLSYCGFDL
jgi:Ni,Fe-hydrogenase III large subunit/Ni,Fe-hydrogenase III component G